MTIVIDENGETISDWTRSDIANEFKKIFCGENILRLLKEKTPTTYLWTYCMSHVVTMNSFGVMTTASNIDLPKTHNIALIKRLLQVLKTIFYSFIRSIRENSVDPIDILFISRDRFLMIKTEKGWIKSDYLFYSIIEGIKERYPDKKIALACTSPPPGDLNIDAYYLYHSYNIVDLLKSLLFSCRISFQWFFLKRKIGATDTINRPQASLFLARLNEFFSFFRMAAIHLTDSSYYRLFTKLQPHIIVSNDDSMQLKPRIDDSSTVFIAMQSASVLPSNELYRRLFITNYGDESIKADYFLCTGEYYKNLKSFSKVAKKVVVTGQPRYDILARRSEMYDRLKMMRNLGLNTDKKLILWATQTHALPYEENVENIDAVHDTMSSLEEVQLAIKLHPAENQIAPLYTGNDSWTPLILGKDWDINALVFACDLLITKDSTTAQEAVLLDKPVIILNLSGEQDRVHYVQEGVAIGVYEPAALAHAIKRSLNDTQFLEELKINREKYIRKYLFKNDGKATERIIDLLDSLHERSNHS